MGDPFEGLPGKALEDPQPAKQLQCGESEIRRHSWSGASTVAALLRIAIARLSLTIAPCHRAGPLGTSANL